MSEQEIAQVVPKETCIAVHVGNQSIASFVGANCEENAQMFADRYNTQFSEKVQKALDNLLKRALWSSSGDEIDNWIKKQKEIIESALQK